MATKLKNMQVTSVDLVRSGANQEADICLYKSAEGTEQPTEHEKNIFKRFLNLFRETTSQPQTEPQAAVQKDYTTFNDINSNRESSEKLWRYTDALTCSIRSIQEDRDLSADQKHQMMKESLSQFDAAMADLFGELCNIKLGSESERVMAAKSEPVYDEIEEIESKKA